MFNTENLVKELEALNKKVNELRENLIKRQTAESSIANGYVNGRSLEEENKLIAMYRLLVGETYAKIDEIEAQLGIARRVAKLSTSVVKGTTDEGIVQTAVSESRKPRKI